MCLVKQETRPQSMKSESKRGADYIDSNSGPDLNNAKPNTTTYASKLNEGDTTAMTRNNDTQSVMPIQHNYDI